MPINFLKKFRILNVNTDMMIKNVKIAELDISIATIFLLSSAKHTKNEPFLTFY